MFKVTEVIDWPIDGDVESLELDSYVEEIRAFPFLTRLEVSRPVDTVHAPGDAHAMVIEGSPATLTDILLASTNSEKNGMGGRGLTVQYGAQVTATNCIVEDNRELGVNAFGEGTTLDMQHVAVTGTLRAACEETWCTGQSGGMGVGAYGGARLTMTDLYVAHNAVCGLQIAHGRDELGVAMSTSGHIELHDGQVVDHPIGVNIQDESFDVTLLQDNVSYIDNERNLDSAYLPVPSMGVTDF
jgi:hypothetical protein